MIATISRPMTAKDLKKEIVVNVIWDGIEQEFSEDGDYDIDDVTTWIMIMMTSIQVLGNRGNLGLFLLSLLR